MKSGLVNQLEEVWSTDGNRIGRDSISWEEVLSASGERYVMSASGERYVMSAGGERYVMSANGKRFCQSMGRGRCQPMGVLPVRTLCLYAPPGYSVTFVHLYSGGGHTVRVQYNI